MKVGESIVVQVELLQAGERRKVRSCAVVDLAVPPKARAVQVEQAQLGQRRQRVQQAQVARRPWAVNLSRPAMLARTERRHCGQLRRGREQPGLEAFGGAGLELKLEILQRPHGRQARHERGTSDIVGRVAVEVQNAQQGERREGWHKSAQPAVFTVPLLTQVEHLEALEARELVASRGAM